jgi:iron(III) transport system ATP-binding protein
VFQGDFTQAHVTWGERELIVRAAAMAPGAFAEGTEAFLSVDPARCVVLEDA